MAKPDPVPTFIEVGVNAKPAVPAEDESEKPLQGDWVDEFLGDREIRPNTKKAYTRQLRGFQVWCEFKHWGDVGEADVSRYKEHLKNKPTKAGKIGLSPASVNQAIATLQSFFKWLATKRYITYNPTLNVEKVPAAPTETKDIEVAAVRQLAEGLEYRGQREQLSTRDTAIFELLKHGLRATEVSKLNIGDYNGQAVQVSKAKWRSDGTVPLAPNARQALDSYLGWCVRKGFDTSSGEPLFRSLSRNGYGKRLGYWGIYEMVKDLGVIAESTENVHPHRLRHTFGTQLVLNDMSPDYVRKLMRIKSPVTSERYTKRALEKKAEDAFNELIERSESGSGLF
ncbi:Phage integrase, N-terminal SAM-like domain protein [Synechococcus sp. PCC 7335]|uniref:tyrosine-type recombinase/integrase n=1 Tax=Synechococcus sp. (strain ATCC 29403 / PCC 7335) TaxID=91464 RepID=UPI00017EDA06|nr:tyrosine-type recombinase/integrase [Synechococcus sp. PCC 7335]EDX82794.1 Phage integrase, N-terminal SAM-like domain protein [Synechococcus sp. PCC 7335]